MDFMKSGSFLESMWQTIMKTAMKTTMKTVMKTAMKTTTYLLSLPTAVYKRAGQSEWSVLEQLFLRISVDFHMKTVKTATFHENHCFLHENCQFSWKPPIFKWKLLVFKSNKMRFRAITKFVYNERPITKKNHMYMKSYFWHINKSVFP